MSLEKLGRYKTEVEERIERRERLALRNKLKPEKDLRDLRGVKRRDRNENVFSRPNGLRQNAETANSYMGPGPTRRGIPLGGRRK